jgi:hypothetical protein
MSCLLVLHCFGGSLECCWRDICVVQVKWSLPRHTNQGILPALINKIATHFLFQMHLAHRNPILNHRNCSSANFENTLGATNNNHGTNIYGAQQCFVTSFHLHGCDSDQPLFNAYLRTH